jgi:PhzF family phenazine biosynthesis protein
MQLPFYQVDAFAESIFTGNPAGVCMLDDWLENQTLQAIAEENNLSETAFVVPYGDDFKIRWFTPKVEVDLCGHATLAAAFVLFQSEMCGTDTLTFESASGLLKVRNCNGLLQLDFPALPFTAKTDIADLMTTFQIPSNEVYQSKFDLLCILSTQQEVETLTPNLSAIAQYPYRGVIVTAKGDDTDVYSRCFYPACNVPEDPVTGSAHCVIAPYWVQRLNQTKLSAKQGGVRKGKLICEVNNGRVLLSGHCQLYMKGEITLPL